MANHEPNLDHEPEVSPDDTQPRVPVNIPSEPVQAATPGIIEPEPAPDDTQPRVPAASAAVEQAAPEESGVVLDEPEIHFEDTPPHAAKAAASEVEPATAEPSVIEGEEPPAAPDDTPSHAVAAVPAESQIDLPEPPSIVHYEPEIAPDDTSPREAVPPVITTFERSSAEPEEPEEQPRAGCGSPLLIAAVTLALLCLFVTSVGLAALAGWRDGNQIKLTRQAATLVANLAEQATLSYDDCNQGRYELCIARCQYIATLQPAYPGMAACIANAQIALSATPSPTIAPTSAPATPTPSPTFAAASDGSISREELLARGEEAVRNSDYESAMKWLEALRGLDVEFRRKDVEDMLVKTYVALGGQYKFEGRLSEMIIVIRKALKIRSLPDTDWEFTINVAEIYLSAKGYLDAGNIEMADKTFSRLMEMAPTFMDTKTLACRAFASAGNTTASQKYSC
ncbi:MAG: hypothetical protein IT324_18210 [Anaerolineae bacterium]|nr:hypothetical protein [Anaerolineae bacterium]